MGGPLAKTASDRAERRSWVAWASIFALALAARLAFLLEARGSPLFSVPLGDGEAYDAWAREIAAGIWLGGERFYQTPPYAYFAGLVYSCGAGPLGLLALQAVLGAASCVLVADAGASFFGRRAGHLAGAWLALYAPAIWFDGSIDKTVLDGFLLALLLAVAGRQAAAPSPGKAALMGAVLGSLVLTRENLLVLAAPLLILVPAVPIRSRSSPSSPGGLPGAGRARRWSLDDAWKLARSRLPIAAGFLLAVAPASARNLALGRGPSPSRHELGVNLFLGNNPDADGLYTPLKAGRGDALHERMDAIELAEADLGRRLDTAEVSRYWLGRALGWAASEPADFARLTAHKLRLVFHDREWMDTLSYQVLRSRSLVLGWLGHPMRFGTLFVLAALGMALCWGERRRLWVLYASIPLVAASIALFFVFARYRFSLVPFLALFAGAALARLGSVAREPRLLARAGAAVLVAAVLAFAPVSAEERPVADTWNNLAAALQRRGRWEESLEPLQIALEDSPDYAMTHFNLGLTLLETERREEAATHFQRAVSLEPELTARARLAWAVRLAREGRLDGALQELHAARAADPRDPDVLAALAKALRHAGRAEEAEARYREALQIRPAFADARNDYGFLLALAGRDGEAAAQFEEALRVDPMHALALENLARLLRLSGDARVRDPSRAPALEELARRSRLGRD
ncbi:MAG TPA: tetratricopeptide repeat protein [Planctomycetota bacterium]|nr:tetratricopeptide repeat protein [Planctomycetota bacterium]